MSLLQTIYNNDNDLYDQVKRFIDQGEDLNSITRHGESALRVASNNGRFDIVQLLLNAGADSNQLEWTDITFKVVFGTLDSIKNALQKTGGLESVDYWSRTPFLFAIQLGDIEKAALLLTLSANRNAVGRCGKTAMAYAIQQNNLSMLAWLVDQGFDIEATDDFLETPLITAASLGKPDCLKFLINCGADIYKANHIPERAIQVAANMEVVRILVDCGDDINDISPEMHAALLGVECDEMPVVSKEAYHAGKYRQFGKRNAEETGNRFWLAMIRSGASAWRASEMFSDSGSKPGQPVWSYKRFGRSTTILCDGRSLRLLANTKTSTIAIFAFTTMSPYLRNMARFAFLAILQSYFLLLIFIPPHLSAILFTSSAASAIRNPDDLATHRSTGWTSNRLKSVLWKHWREAGLDQQA